MLVLISYIATAAVLISYAYMVKTENIKQFNWINFISATPLVALAIMSGAIPNAIISAFFGVVGLYGVINDRIRPPS
jgi:hypothetical protein